MFFTSLSSPLVSVFLAIILPWLVITFGKNNSEPVQPVNTNILTTTAVKSSVESTAQLYIYRSHTKTKSTKQHIDLRQVVLQYCIFYNPPNPAPDNYRFICKLGLCKRLSGRAPPFMFT